MESLISGLIIVSIFLVLYAVTNYVNAQKRIREAEKEINRIKKQQDSLEKDHKRSLEELTKYTHHLNRSYMLGLSDDEIIEIVNSENSLDTFANKVTHTPPDPHEYYVNMEETISALFDEMYLSDEQKEKIVLIFLRDFMPGVTEDMLKELAYEFGKSLPAKLYFLKDKINYELAALGVMMTIAQKTNDFDLKRKVNGIRRNRGYI